MIPNRVYRFFVPFSFCFPRNIWIAVHQKTDCKLDAGSNNWNDTIVILFSKLLADLPEVGMIFLDGDESENCQSWAS